jgi:hypothetical protein
MEKVILVGKQRIPLPGRILQRTISHRFDSIGAFLAVLLTPLHPETPRIAPSLNNR